MSNIVNEPPQNENITFNNQLINDVINFNDKKWHNLHHTYVENQFEKGRKKERGIWHKREQGQPTRERGTHRELI